MPGDHLAPLRQINCFSVCLAGQRLNWIIGIIVTTDLPNPLKTASSRFGGAFARPDAEQSSATDIKFPIRKAIIDIGIFSFGVNALMLVMPLYMLQIYDRVLNSASIDTLVFLSIIAGFALVILGALEAVRSMYGTRIANRLDFAYSRPAMLSAMKNAGTTGNEMRIVRDLAQVRNFLNSRLAFIVFDLPFAPLFIGVLYFIHPLLFWITLGGVVVLVLLALANQWASDRAGKSAKSADALSQISAQSLLRNAESLRALGMTDNALRVWESHQLDNVGSSDQRARVSSFMTGLSRTIRMGLQITVLGVGAYLVLNQQMTAGMIFAASIISGKGLQPIDQVIGSWRQIVDCIVAWGNMRKQIVLKQPQAVHTDFPAPAGRVTAENLIYFPRKTKGAPAVVKGVSFNIPAGTSLGVLGKSGAGKSTLMRLLAGAIEPSSGVVRLDNNDLKNWDPEKLGRHLGYVEQRVELLPGTIAQNIARFDANVDDADVIAAANAAHIARTIEALPESYQTIVGPGGQQLSGGEMQQIGLARAFYGDPQILLLDEPNSNLDPEARTQFDKAIIAAREAGKTIVIITQRDEILKHVDVLLALKDGKILDIGTRDDVLERQFGVKKPAPPRPANIGDAPDEQRAKKSAFAGFGPGMQPLSLKTSIPSDDKKVAQ